MSTSDEKPLAPGRMPPWLRKRVSWEQGSEVRATLDDLRLETVCRGAQCPNIGECYGKGRATFLIMGPNCTRSCAFCAISHEGPAPLDADEPARVAEAVCRLNLCHAVVTSVTRDDLPDGGSAHFAATIRAIRARHACTIEVLTPDFQGDEKALATVADAAPDVFNHNIETVPRLYATVRPQADYQQSLAVLAWVAKRYPAIRTKSGMMVGLGETEAEVLASLRDLREAGVQSVTIGQYLCPKQSENHPVVEYVHPDQFAVYRDAALALGFAAVASSPFVRSSYNAYEGLTEMNAREHGGG